MSVADAGAAPWASLHARHSAMCRAHGESLSSEIRKRLIRLAELGHCDPSIRGRFTPRKTAELREWWIRPLGNDAEHPEPLRNLPELECARLTVLALVDARKQDVHQFTAMLEGKSRSGRDWVVAVHLDDERRGAGACSHASFHCHVGPDLHAVPKVRVPLPDVGPVAALDWLLSLVVPRWEPAPWDDVAEAK